MHSSDLVLASTHIYCHAALNEAQGMAVIEAMLYGLPIIVADKGGLPFVIKHEQTGIVSEPTSGSFLDAIQRLLSDLDRATALGVAAQRDAIERFSWVTVMRRFENIYHCDQEIFENRGTALKN